MDGSSVITSKVVCRAVVLAGAAVVVGAWIVVVVSALDEAIEVDVEVAAGACVSVVFPSGSGFVSSAAGPVV